jgi:hypothetical protein
MSLQNCINIARSNAASLRTNNAVDPDETETDDDETPNTSSIQLQKRMKKE